MKIAIIYDAVYPYVVGGGEKRYWEIARRLASKDNEVCLVGMKYWEGPDEIVKERVRLIGVCQAIPLYNKKGGRSFSEPFYFGFYVFLHLLKNGYDVIDCANFPYISCLAARSAVIFNRKPRKQTLIITWLEVWGRKYWRGYSGFLGYAGAAIEKIVSLVARHHICISEFTRIRARKILGMRHAGVVPAGIDYNGLRRAVSLDGKADQIIFVGRLLDYKQAGLLIKAFKGVVDDSAGRIRLKILGSGPEEQNLRSLSKRLGIEDMVEFLGFLEREKLEHEISVSKVLVQPSLREGLGVAMIESMALGTPVIAFDSEYSAASTIIRDRENGLIFRSEAELRGLIREVFADKELYGKISAGGYETARAYDWDKAVVPALEESYRKAVRNESSVLMVNALDITYGSTHRFRKFHRFLKENGYATTCIESNYKGDDPDVISIDQPLTVPGFFAGTMRRIVYSLTLDYDIIFIQKFLPFTVFCALAAKLRNKKVMVDCDDLDSALQKKPLRKYIISFFERNGHRLADIIFAHNNYLLEHLKKVTSKPVVLVRQGIDTSLFDPADYDRGLLREKLHLDGKTVLIYSAGFSAGGIGDFDIVIKAVEAAGRSVENIYFIVMGGGPLLEECRNRYSALDHIRFTGYLDQRVLCEYLAAADIGLVYMRDNPGNLMRVSLKLMEFLAMGKTVVGHTVGENRDVFGKYYVEAGEGPESFGRHIAEAINKGLKPVNVRGIIEAYSLGNMEKTFLENMRSVLRI